MMANQLANLLARLRRDNIQQSGLTHRLVPADRAAGQRVAEDVAAALGWTIGGWKIAANKPDMQRALRTDAPIYGRVYKQFIHQSPMSFAGRKLLNPISEMELVVMLGQDLPVRPQPYTRNDVADAIASVHPGLEIAECRFIHDDKFPPLAAIIADGSGSGSVVLGPAIENWRDRDIAGQDVVLRINGVAKRQGNVANAIDHPLVPLTWLSNELSRTGIGLKAGEIVSTGTLTGMVSARPGDQHIADFGPLGEVSVQF